MLHRHVAWLVVRGWWAREPDREGKWAMANRDLRFRNRSGPLIGSTLSSSAVPIEQKKDRHHQKYAVRNDERVKHGIVHCRLPPAATARFPRKRTKRQRRPPPTRRTGPAVVRTARLSDRQPQGSQAVGACRQELSAASDSIVASSRIAASRLPIRAVPMFERFQHFLPLDRGNCLLRRASAVQDLRFSANPPV